MRILLITITNFEELFSHIFACDISPTFWTVGNHGLIFFSPFYHTFNCLAYTCDLIVELEAELIPCQDGPVLWIQSQAYLINIYPILINIYNSVWSNLKIYICRAILSEFWLLNWKKCREHGRSISIVQSWLSLSSHQTCQHVDCRSIQNLRAVTVRF